VTQPVFDNAQLTSGDFLKLMIQELVNQDPLNPLKNEDLLAQISQIKNMETLSKLDQTMTGMRFQQGLATAGALLGTSVKGVSTAGANVSGLIVKVTASNANGVNLVTSEGYEIPVNKVTEITW
jgi:flagellar basal-body rod modification protein FlgD